MPPPAPLRNPRHAARRALFQCMRSGGRVVEGARLESEYTPKAYPGFESLPLRHLGVLSRPNLTNFPQKSAGFRVFDVAS